jgi:hypothetical protein
LDHLRIRAQAVRIAEPFAWVPESVRDASAAHDRPAVPDTATDKTLGPRRANGAHT